jgi:trehalose synthase
MYATLAISHRALNDLSPAAGDPALEERRSLARPLEGLRVLNLSLTGFGTGTAELLNSSVPLLNDLGLDCDWQVIRASEDATIVTRAMYQALGGTYVHWTHDMTETWLRYAEMNGRLLTERFDTIIVHDPQPAAIRSFADAELARHWLVHSHLDLSEAQEDVWLLLRGHIEQYDAAVFDAPSFSRNDISIPTHIVPPAIDPNSARNMPLPREVIDTVLARYGIDPEKPMICQVSPCDPSFDLTGAVEAWRMVRRRRPELQMAIVLTTDPQDPQGRAHYEELGRLSAEEPELFVLCMGNDVGNVELNVFQRAASVVLQKGLRRGFGMWIADALWKERPCVVSPASGLRAQVIDGETGIVAASTQEFAAGIERILSEPETARRFGENGRRHVGERFLITRYLRDYLGILGELHRKP